MSDDILVKVENVSKKFCRSLKKSLWYGMKDLASEALGESRNHDHLRKDEFWAIDDVSFELRRGECLGLIGRNGAGKTTLLKMLNGLIKPDKGRIEMHGRIGALIALGTGFNPILTGRENIYVNGSVLGFSKKEIDKKFDDIVDFAEIGDFIDTPVQSYSSGMAVRLGFAIAAQMDPDILIIDEILAVGDAGFRAKCYETISKLLRNSAVIFVSHSMNAIQRISNYVLVMTDGHKVFLGQPSLGIDCYFDIFKNKNIIKSQSIGTGEAKIENFIISDVQGKTITKGEYSNPFSLEYDLTISTKYKEYIVSITFMTMSHEIVAQWHSESNNQKLGNDGKLHHIKIYFDSLLLSPGIYNINIVVLDKKSIRHLCWEIGIKKFIVKGGFAGSAPVQLIGKYQIN